MSAGGIGGPARDLKHKNGEPYFNYEDTVGPFERPFISHEIGQYTSFPDPYSWFNEEKYTGPLKAHYIGMIRERFERFHPPERGPKFAQASGALQVLAYKTEIEAMLRTPSMDGFHLNGLMDYPGEGIALIGMLDAMGDSKGLISPKEFRRFCSETVALVAMEEDGLLGGSLFKADAMVRHHGPTDMDGSQWYWRISERSGEVLLKGDLGSHNVSTGGLTQLGKIEARLPHVAKAKEMTLSLSMTDNEVTNEWSFWVFPAKVDVAIPDGVLFADAWTEPVRKALQEGRSVLLSLDDRSLVDSVPCSYWPVFWGRGLFPQIPRPMGIYCDPGDPALASFPTRDHSQFQWYSLLMESTAMNLNKLPFDFKPVVYMIDDFNECERLGLVLAAEVDQGRLIATSLNLGKEGGRTLAQKQILKSLIAHAASRETSLAQSLTLEQLEHVFQPPQAKVIAVSSANPGMEKENMQDGNPQTFWHTRFQPDFAKPPHYVVLEVPTDTIVAGLSYTAYAGGNGNGHVKACSIYVSDDAKNWGKAIVKSTLQPNVNTKQQILFPILSSKAYIKFESTDAVSYGGQPIAAVGELEVLPMSVNNCEGAATGQYLAPDLPSPQDWVLVMERSEP